MSTPHGDGEQEIWVMNSALTHFPHCALWSCSSCVLIMTHTFYPNCPDKSHSVLLKTRHAISDLRKKAYGLWACAAGFKGSVVGKGRRGSTRDPDGLQLQLLRGLSTYVCMCVSMPVHDHSCACVVAQKATNTVKHDFKLRIDQCFSYTPRRRHDRIISNVAQVSL